MLRVCKAKIVYILLFLDNAITRDHTVSNITVAQLTQCKMFP